MVPTAQMTQALRSDSGALADTRRVVHARPEIVAPGHDHVPGNIKLYSQCQGRSTLIQPTHYLLFGLDAVVFLHRSQVCHISRDGATKLDELSPTVPYQRSPALRVGG